ncbi:MAG TPA: DMT family transporter [Candidatus Ozemobacteraceae bacterium]|nr:DMT family transporter [Candidatus Ozemobacteraceae bacterium]
MTNDHTPSSGFLSPHAVGLLLVTAAATLWSFAGVAVKLLPGLDPLAITGWRSLFALPVVVAVWRLRGVSPEPGTGVYVAGSAVSYAMMVMLFISATRMTTAANAIVLQYTAPLWVAVFSRAVLGETVSRREWLMMAACLAGMGFFFLDKLSFAGRLGNGLAIVSGIACGLNTLFLRRLSRQGEPPAGPERSADTGWNGIPALVLGNLLVIVFSAGSMMRGLPAGATEWGVLAALGVFQLSVPYVLFLIGIRTVTAVESMLFAMLEAILNPLWVGFGAGEWPSPGAVVGAGLILSSMAAYGIARANGRSRERQR